MMIAALAGLLGACANEGPDPVRVVGSSTVFPFAAKTAEVYAERSGVRMVVEQTGSGGGHKLFCSGDPSINATTSSRRQKPSEAALCAENGVAPIVEVRLGFDGIVLARSATAVPMALNAVILYRALARELPKSGLDCTPVPNPYTIWSQIDPSLPDNRIEAYGPPPTSGTRDAFIETAMEAGARQYACLADMERETPNLFRGRAHKLREDGYWIDAGENDNILVQTLISTPTALGVFGFSFLEQNMDKVAAVSIDGVLPSRRTIRSGDYPVVRDLYLYLRGEDESGVIDYALEFSSDEASGPGGYLEAIGLIPLHEGDRAVMRRQILAVAGSVQ